MCGRACVMLQAVSLLWHAALPQYSGTLHARAFALSDPSRSHACILYRPPAVQLQGVQQHSWACRKQLAVPGTSHADITPPSLTRAPAPCPPASGATREHPGLLEYACQLHTNVLPIAPLTLDVPYTRANGRTRGSPEQDEGKQEGSWWRRGHQARHEEDISYILGGKPLVALAFNDMVMTVNEPEQLILQVPSVLNN